VAFGLQALTCAKMAKDHGPTDLFGTNTFVACAPPRLCSAGEDLKSGTPDDACSELVEGESASEKSLRAGWTRRFLNITSEMRPGCGSADATVVHFYAALIRRDGSHLGALPPRSEWDDTLVRKMEKHDKFYFHGARLQGLACASTRCDYEVHLQVSSSPSSKASGGVDQGRLERRGSNWMITRPPT
jgi:hypothetical protein